MIKRIILLTLLFAIALPTLVSASELRSQGYYTHQTIDNVREFVELRDKTIYVKLDARIDIDNTIFNDSDWVTFSFSPILYDTDRISSFKSSIGLQTSEWGGGDVFIPNNKANYKQTNESKNYFVYNVSLKNLKGRNSIIFNANYTIENRIFRVRDFIYEFFYQSRVETLNHNTYFRFPNHLEFIRVKDPNKLKQGSGFQDYEVRNDETKEALNFVFEDTNERKSFELQEKKQEGIWDITLIIIGAIIGLLLTVLYENISNKDKRLFGNIKIKKFKRFQKVIIKIFKK